MCNWIAHVNVEVSAERLWSLRMICLVLVHESDMAIVDWFSGHPQTGVTCLAPWICYSS